MKVKIGEVIIEDAQVKRFIDLQSGLPLSMIKVSYVGEGFPQLGKALQENALIPFECEILKTQVLVHASSHNSIEKRHEYVFMERGVPCGYKLIHTEPTEGKEKAISVPEDTDNALVEKLRELPFIRLILEKDVP